MRLEPGAKGRPGKVGGLETSLKDSTPRVCLLGYRGSSRKNLWVYPMGRRVKQFQSTRALLISGIRVVQRHLWCMHVLRHFSRVQLFATPMDCTLPGSSVHEISQARILEWVAMPSSRGSSQPRDRTHVSYVSCIGRWVLYH